MATLYDPTGMPIAPEVIAALREPDQSAPVLGGVRSIVSQQFTDGMTPYRMAQIHKAQAMGDTLAYQEMAEDIEDRDTHYFSVLSTRKLSVTQLPLNVVAASADAEHVKHKEFLEDWLQSGILDGALMDMLDGIGKGYSVHEIEWDIRPGKPYVPKELNFRLARWFEVDRDDGNTLLLRDGAGNLPLAPWKYVVHRHKVKSGLLLRSGLARIASWIWMYKAFTLNDWAIFVQNFGAPVRVGRYGPEASVSDKAILWRAVSNIAGDCAAIIPKTMEIEFIQPAGLAGAAEVHERRAKFLEQQLSKVVLGQTATTDAIAGGHAVGKEHRQVQEDIERADAKQLATTVARKLFAIIISLNFGPQEAYPSCVIGHTDDVPLEEIVKALQFLGPQGLTVSAREMREQLGFSEPEPDEDVVGGRPTAPQAPTPTVSSPELPTSSVDPPSDFGKPEKTPAETEKVATQSMVARLLSMHTQALDPELVELMSERLAKDAQGALAGLTHQVLEQIEAATDMHDLAHRMARLELDPEQMTLAMQRGLAIANLAGQAALLDQIRGAR